MILTMEHKEIGGFFELESLISHEYYPDGIALNTARNALAYIIRARRLKKIYIPFFLCDTVEKVCVREGCEYECYHIRPDFYPDFKGAVQENERLYIVNYYGQLSVERILREYGADVIMDNVQAFFQPPIPGMDTIYSCRKYFGVPDGAYLFSDAKLDGLETDRSGQRLAHLVGRMENSASEYYHEFQKNDESFYELDLKLMSRFTHTVLGAIDYPVVKRHREENFAVLHSLLRDTNRLNPLLPVGPFAYPYYCENGPAVRKKMAEIKIYIPTLWPDVCGNETETEYACHILPLPCDQRYTREDMYYLVEQLKKRI